MAEATVIYHGDCPDGFTGAWLLRRHLLRSHREITMVAGKYSTTPPDVKGDTFLVDFCYEPEHLEKLHKQSDTLTVLDHHQTALGWCQEFWGHDHVVETWDSDLHRLTDVVVLDQNHSGAMLAMLWTGLHVNFVKFIEDRDLWRFKYGQRTHDVFASVTSHPYDWTVWDLLADTPVDELFIEGSAINRYRDRLIENTLKEAYTTHVLGYDHIWVVAAPYAIGSDVAGELAKRDPDRFAGYYVDKPDNTRRWGLRSTDQGLDVASLAATRGGGGHKHASGYETPRETP